MKFNEKKKYIYNNYASALYAEYFNAHKKHKTKDLTTIILIFNIVVN